jgi:hypothetical protein
MKTPTTNPEQFIDEAERMLLKMTARRGLRQSGEKILPVSFYPTTMFKPVLQLVNLTQKEQWRLSLMTNFP